MEPSLTVYGAAIMHSCASCLAKCQNGSVLNSTRLKDDVRHIIDEFPI